MGLNAAAAARPSGRRILDAVGVLLALALLSAFAAVCGFHRYEPDRNRYPLRGIDVSHHQRIIDWPRVAASDVSFAYLKASEGGDHHDRHFAANWQAARQAGIATGAYHFFTFCRPGREQADNFLAAVPVAADALPPAVDLEFGGNCGARPEGVAMRRELDAFLAPVEARGGKPAILYVTPEFLAEFAAHLPDRALWRRSLVRLPDGSAGWTLWQYHNRGSVPGIAGPVDLNVFAGDREAFARFAAGEWRAFNGVSVGDVNRDEASSGRPRHD